jgi:hypothetical protein
MFVSFLEVLGFQIVFIIFMGFGEWNIERVDPQPSLL